MKAKCAALLAGMLLLSATRAGATTYAVSLFDGFHNIAVGGSITTDGNTGSLALTDIVDWNLIGVSENSILQVLFNLTGPLSGDNSFINAATFSNIVATPTTLSLGIPAAELHFVATMSLMQPSIGGIIFESFPPPPGATAADTAGTWWFRGLLGRRPLRFLNF